MDRRRLLELVGLGALGVAAADLTLLRQRRLRGPGHDGGAGGAGGADAADEDVVAHPSRPTQPTVAPDDRRAARPGDRPVAVAAPAVVCRAEWGAAAPTGRYRRHRIERLTVHHTAVAAPGGGPTPERLARHQSHHLASGFVDLAYHVVIDPAGTVYEGRPARAAGESRTSYDPAGHYLACLEGDFDRHPPTDVQLTSLVEVLAWAAATFAVAPTTLRGHRSYAVTACPGDGLQARVDDGSLRRMVTERLAVGPVADLACGV